MMMMGQDDPVLDPFYKKRKWTRETKISHKLEEEFAHQSGELQKISTEKKGLRKISGE